MKTGRWKRRAQKIALDVAALRLAMKDPRTPFAAKAVAALVVAYALSPVDFIPDFIPLIGQLDDLILVPLGVLLAAKLVPPPLLAEFRAAAAAISQSKIGSGSPLRGFWKKTRFGLAMLIGLILVALGLWTLGWLRFSWI